MEAALRTSEKLSLLGRITASIMHEINNPAEALSNIVYLIGQSSESPELVKSLAELAEEQLTRIQYVARQTLSYFKDAPQKRRLDVVPLVHTAIRFHEQSLSRKKIRLRQQLPETLFASIFPGDLLQLISNLLGNAIEAVPPGGALCIRLRGSEDRIRLTVADNGCGIPKSLRAHLFEPFHTGREDKGNGLGLWICKSIAERHGGRISCRTSTAQDSHGTTFSLSIAS